MGQGKTEVQMMQTKFKPGQRVLVDGTTEQTIIQTAQIVGDGLFGEEEGKIYTCYHLDDGRLVAEDRLTPLFEEA